MPAVKSRYALFSLSYNTHPLPCTIIGGGLTYVGTMYGAAWLRKVTVGESGAGSGLRTAFSCSAYEKEDPGIVDEVGTGAAMAYRRKGCRVRCDEGRAAARERARAATNRDMLKNAHQSTKQRNNEQRLKLRKEDQDFANTMRLLLKKFSGSHRSNCVGLFLTYR